MFFRTKKSGPRTYLQIVESVREGKRVRQRVLATLGRIEVLNESGQLARLLESGARFAEKVAVLNAHRSGETVSVKTTRVGPDLLFGRLWKELGMREVIESALEGRRYEFSVERAIYLTVLHRLFVGGSDRDAEHWRRDYRIPGAEEIELHHLYRAMAWLGEELPQTEQAGSTGFSPRCVKDRIEERLFARRRDLFTDLSLVFFDTTSIYFEGEGGGDLGRRGKSKDHRPGKKQLVAGAILDREGTPICSEIWPGNTSDVTTLLPVADRLKRRFGIEKLTVVCDRGMIAKKTMAELEQRGMKYILGARMRSVKEVREEVLSRPGAYRMVRGPRERSKDPSPLKVKEVRIEGRRYVVCLNLEHAVEDRRKRERILAGLRKALKSGDKSLVGNKGYRRYLKSAGGFEIDEKKAKEEERFDGKWVLQTNFTKEELSTEEVALRYKDLWMVEDVFRWLKSVLRTRPVWHKRDETIRGHVFASFLALMLLKELLRRLAASSSARAVQGVEWGRLKRDLDALEETEVQTEKGQSFLLRSNLRGDCGRALQAAGVAIPPTVRVAP